MSLKSLSQIRQTHRKTQVEVAASLGVSQSVISKIESGRDVSVAQLREYIAALGGQLVISARFGSALTPLDVTELRYGERAPTRRVAERAGVWRDAAAASARVVAEPVVAPEWLDEVDRIRAMSPTARMQEVANVSAFFAAAKRRG